MKAHRSAGWRPSSAAIRDVRDWKWPLAGRPGEARRGPAPLRRQPRIRGACCKRLEPIAFSKITQVTFAAPRTSTCVMP